MDSSTARPKSPGDAAGVLSTSSTEPCGASSTTMGAQAYDVCRPTPADRSWGGRGACVLVRIRAARGRKNARGAGRPCPAAEHHAGPRLAYSLAYLDTTTSRSDLRLQHAIGCGAAYSRATFSTRVPRVMPRRPTTSRARLRTACSRRCYEVLNVTSAPWAVPPAFVAEILKWYSVFAVRSLASSADTAYRARPGPARATIITDGRRRDHRPLNRAAALTA